MSKTNLIIKTDKTVFWDSGLSLHFESIYTSANLVKRDHKKLSWLELNSNIF